MPWVKLDDGFRHHPKAIRVGPLGRDLFVCGLGYCAEQLSDGFIPDDMVTHIAPGLKNCTRVVRRLLMAGFWTRDDERGGYVVHDYLQWNRPATRVRADREAAKKRKDDWLERKRNAVPNASGTAEERKENASPSSPVPSRPVPSTQKLLEALSGNGARRPDPSRESLRIEAGAILEWLNEKSGKHFRAVAVNLTPIEARLREGIAGWQLRKIVTVKVREWSGDAKTKVWIRPETLFGKTKCEQYVGELPPGDDA